MAQQARADGGIVPPERLCEAGENLEIWRVHYSCVKEQDLNARVMPPEMLERLTENMRKEGRIESLPFGVMRDGYVELISGHHRVRAAVAAGVLEFPILVDTRRELDADSVKAKQLAHNSICGSDDPDVLDRIFSQIETIEARFEAFVDLGEAHMKALDEAVRSLNEEVVIDWPVLAITFLPHQLERFEAIAERLARQVPKDADQVWVVPDDIAQRFVDVLNRVGKRDDIRTMGNILARMTEMAEEMCDSAMMAEQDPAEVS